MTNCSFRTGDVIYADFSNGIGSQQKGKRYAVIISNNVGNSMSSTVQVLPATTKRNNSCLPTHAHFNAGECSLPQDTVFLAEQAVTINKFQIIRVLDKMTESQLKRIAKALLCAIPMTVTAVSEIINTPQFERLRV
jgi:mRNA-degrading endonuclease toxin of MazEF toxin-antitoxin module